MNKISLKKYGRNNNYVKRKNYVFLLLLIIFFLTVGYSSIGTVLSLRGQVFVRTDKIAPTVEYNVLGGNYNTNQSIEITPIDNESGVDYYNVYVYKDGVLLDSYENLETKKHEILLSENGTYEVRTFVVDIFGNVINMEPIIDEMYYQTYLIDKEKPTLTTSIVYTDSTQANITITAEDNIGGSGLSNENNYQYCVSSRNSTDGCVWLDYSSSESFELTGNNEVKYLFVYPIKDNVNNISGDNEYVTVPYLIGTYYFDTIAPTLTVTTSINSNAVDIILSAEDTGGSGLSNENIYQYCLSSNSDSITDCTWTDYVSGETFTLSGSGTKYLFTYPIKDNYGNVNDSKTFGTSYMITIVTFCSSIPQYTYLKSDGTAASSTLIDDGNGNWRIKFLTNGTFTLTQPICASSLDVFLVGGGSGGNGASNSNTLWGGGGGGGYTKTVFGVKFELNKGYDIVIGAGGSAGATNGVGGSGGTTKAFDQSANGGGRASSYGLGNPGGSGGAGSYYGRANLIGGTNGSNGGTGSNAGGAGQITTTYEFGDSSLTLYSPGGVSTTDTSYNPKPNTGGGGRGGTNTQGTYQPTAGSAGASGIVVIRNSQYNKIGDIAYTYTGTSETVDDGDGNWRIKFKSSGTLIFRELPNNQTIDLFLVGGGSGGNGASNTDTLWGGGGGGGYTNTVTGIQVQKNVSYNIVVGSGGAAGSIKGLGGKGGTTTAFNQSANGGGVASTFADGNPGGSGGVGAYYGRENLNRGVNGSSGISGNGGIGGAGQSTTTYEFGDSSLTLYSLGGVSTTDTSYDPKPNTGGGGRGGTTSQGTYFASSGSAGGSGIVVIRNAR